MPGAGAAITFRDRDAEETHLGEAFPELLVVRRLAVEHVAHRFRRGMFREVFPSLVAQLLLVVGEIEIHGPTSAVIPGRAPFARTRNLDVITSGFRIGPKTGRPE